jgi:hypothetical protein
VDNGSSDNSGTVYLKICNDTFDCGDLGANLVELEVYDDFGNKDFCTATVTVVDDIDPEISCPGNSQTLPDTGQNFYTLPNYVANNDVTASDNCESEPAISQDPAPGTQLPIGVHTINFEAQDGNGNTQSCSFNLTVTEVLGASSFEFEEGLRLYPNPVTDILNIHSGTSAIETISVVDISGKLILQLTDLNAIDATLDLSSISRGIYFVRVNDIVTKKVVKR